MAAVVRIVRINVAADDDDEMMSEILRNGNCLGRIVLMPFDCEIQTPNYCNNVPTGDNLLRVYQMMMIIVCGRHSVVCRDTNT